MNTKSRRVIYGSRIEGAKIHADDTRERAMQAVREADRAEAEAWSIRMEGYGGGGGPGAAVPDDRAMPQRRLRLGHVQALRDAGEPPFRRRSAGRGTRRSGTSKWH
jgi:hypothetical protein